MLTVQRTKWKGKSLRRKEDLRFLTGRGWYTGDIKLPNLAYAAFVRSPYPHARIVNVRKAKAEALPHVIGVITGKEIAAEVNSLPNLLASPHNQQKDFGIAVDKVRYAGEPVALVVAEDKYAAADAVDEVEVDYEQLAPILSPQKALENDSSLVHENLPSNAMWHRKFTYGDVDGAFGSADLTVKKSFHFHRFTSAPLEPNVILVKYDDSQQSFTIWSNNQRPAYVASLLAKALKVSQNRLRFVSPDIGGGFGIKVDSYSYMLVLAVAARKVNRPVLWEEFRREHMQASTHGNEVYYDAEIALKRDGTILAYRGRAIHDEGAYMRREPLGALNFIRHATLTYRIGALEMDIWAVATNKCPVGPNRCYGKMQQNFLIEMLVSAAARKLGMDPAELRAKNQITSDQMPYETPTGAILDGGDFPSLLTKLLTGSDYSALRREQKALRAQGRLIGVGLSMGMDSSPVNPSFGRILNPAARVSGESEAAWVRMNEDASIAVAVGTSPQGQGHETTVAQIVADVLGVHPDEVNVLPGFDTWTHPYTPTSGTYASRFATTAAAAVSGAADKLRQKILRISQSVLGEAAEDLDLIEGNVVSTKGKSMPLREVAEIAWKDLSRLPRSEEPGLVESFVYRVPLSLPVDDQRGNFALSYSSSACLVVVEIDRRTGEVHVKRIRIIEDSGNKINPMIIEGQIHGQVAHQLGAALLERHVYNDDGQLLTSTFMEYLAARATDLVAPEVDSLTVPSMFTLLGTRGTAEGGGAPLIACVDAVNDALQPLGLEVGDSFIDQSLIRDMITKADVNH